MTVFKDNEEIATSDINNELYILRTLVSALKVSVTHSENCIHQWHRRLGHRNTQAIQQLFDEDLADGMKISPCEIEIYCEDCIRGKLSHIKDLHISCFRAHIYRKEEETGYQNT